MRQRRCTTACTKETLRTKCNSQLGQRKGAPHQRVILCTVGQSMPSILKGRRQGWMVRPEEQILPTAVQKCNRMQHAGTTGRKCRRSSRGNANGTVHGNNRTQRQNVSIQCTETGAGEMGIHRKVSMSRRRTSWRQHS